MKLSINKKSFKNLYSAFEKYCKEKILFGIVLTISSLIIAFIPILFPEISHFLNKHIVSIIVLIGIIVAIFIYRFITWKQNNFFTTEASMKAMIIINGKNDNKLTLEVFHLIVPSDDSLLLTLKLTFDEEMQKELIENTYTLFFTKPQFLEMSCKNPKNEYTELYDGINKYYYGLSFKYNYNVTNTYLFKLEASSEVHGYLKLYFVVGDKNSNFKEIINKQSPLWEQKIRAENLEIDSNNCIIIDKRNQK